MASPTSRGSYLVATDRFFGDAPGGQYGIAWELARAARDAGHRTALLCGSVDGDPPAGPSDVEGVEVVRYRIPGRRWWKPSRFPEHVQALAASFRAHLASTRWDTVHAHSLVSGSLLGSGLPARRTVFTAHSPATLELSVNWSGTSPGARLRRAVGLRAIRRVEAKALRASTAVHVLSEFTRAELTRAHGAWASERMVRIPWWCAPDAPGADRARARRLLGLPEGGPVLFSLRRLVPRMGLDTFVDALGRLAPEHPFTAVIGGEGPERVTLERRAAELLPPGRIRFVGRLSDRERDLAYRAADLFVVPTRALECFGMIVLEALAQGCPVMASRAGALPEILDPALPGWTFEPGSVDGLAGLLGSFLRGDLVSPEGDRLRAWVQERYARARVWPAYESLITG